MTAIEGANAALLDSWELSLHSKQPRTRKLYLEEAGRFAAWMAGHGQPDLLAVTKRDCERWITALRDDRLSTWTIRSRWIAMRNFYRWASGEGEMDVSPLAKIVVPKANDPAPDTLTAVELKALFDGCAGTDFKSRRDLAILRLMAATGLRLAEENELEVADVDLRTRIATIRGKGDRPRIVRFDPATAVALDRYKRVRARHKYASKPWLWLADQGRLTRKGMGYVISKRGRDAGIEGFHPHRLRHTWADRWLSAGGNEGDLQKLGGWESADIMRRYGSARAVDRALNAYDDINPMGDI